MPFFVELPSNPSTGYLWTLKKEEMKIIKHMDANVTGKMNKLKSKKIGAASTQTFTFLPEQKGSENLTFSYIRPWENDTASMTNYEVQVTITLT